MPQAGRGYYVDAVCGTKYGAFFKEELSFVARSFFPLSDRREDNFIAGLSMGGYGAFSLALSHPEKYAAAVSLSGALDIVRMLREGNDLAWQKEKELIFGKTDAVAGGPYDLFALAEKHVRSGISLPQLYACCGTDDFLYQGNLAFKAHAKAIGLPLVFKQGPGGHTWNFWDRWVQQGLAWLPINEKGAALSGD